jgi:pyruvate/2-oxoglutarate dehydrogenase complex dihydrolipoamide dehydrogenase (E3) component
MSATATKWDYDVAVVGGGSAGYAAARTAASHGLKTALVEGAEQMGGLCILRGCMPSKALLYASEVLHLANNAKTWGIRVDEVGFNFHQVMARKNAMIQDFAEYRVKQLENGKFRLVRATARFTDPHTLVLSDGKQLTAANFVIATGSTPPPALSRNCKSSVHEQRQRAGTHQAAALFDRPRRWRRGDGIWAVFARFGVKVTQIQRSPHVLHGFDTDAAEVLETVFRREGVTLYTGTKLADSRRLGHGKEVTFEHNGKSIRVHADEVFYGLGRVPRISNLGLDKIGVDVLHTRVVTDSRMRTTIPHIYAAGDCAGLHEIVHIAIQQGETAALNIAGNDRKMDYRLLSEVIFTDPQAAIVGLTESARSWTTSLT